MNLHRKLLYVAMSLAFAPGTLFAADQDTTAQNPPSRNPGAADKKVQNLDAVSVTATKRVKSPLQLELDGLTKIFGLLAWTAVAIIAIVGFIRQNDPASSSLNSGRSALPMITGAIAADQPR